MGAQRWVNHPTLGRMTLEHYNEISPLIRPLRVTVDAADYDRDVSETRDTALKDAISAVRGRLVASDFDYGTNAQGLDLACEAIQRLLDGEIDE